VIDMGFLSVIRRWALRYEMPTALVIHCARTNGATMDNRPVSAARDRCIYDGAKDDRTQPGLPLKKRREPTKSEDRLSGLSGRQIRRNLARSRGARRFLSPSDLS
jgi:hypothetical protein